MTEKTTRIKVTDHRTKVSIFLDHKGADTDVAEIIRDCFVRVFLFSRIWEF